MKIQKVLLAVSFVGFAPLSWAQTTPALDNLPVAASWAGSYVGLSLGRSVGERRSLTSASSSTFAERLPGADAYCFNTASQSNISGQDTENACLTSGKPGTHVWYPEVLSTLEVPEEFERVSEFAEESRRQNRNTLGIKAGHNWQAATERLVYGVEVDYTRLRGRTTSLGTTVSSETTSGPAQLTTSSTLNGGTQWVGTVRGRLGYASEDNSWLPYVTAGMAWGRTTASGVFSFEGSTPGVDRSTSFEQSKVKHGLVLGLGLDYRVNQNVVVGVSYMVARLGRGLSLVEGNSASDIDGVSGDFLSAGTGTARVSPTIGLAALSVSYKFN